MDVKFELISIENVSNGENGKERITLTLYGSNLTLYLQNYSWNDLLDKIIAERRNLLLKSVLLHFHANNSKNFTVNKETYVIERGYNSIDTLEPLCPQGQSLAKNGFICGKFRKRLSLVFSKNIVLRNYVGKTLGKIYMRETAM